MFCKITVCSALCAVALLIAACSSDKDQRQNAAAVTELLDSAGDFPEIPEYDSTLSPKVVEDTVGDEVLYCKRTTHKISSGNESFPLFDPNADIIYPGNLLQGATLGRATPSPIVVKCGPGTVILTLMNGADSMSQPGRTIPEVNLQNVVNTANAIISDNPGNLPARTSFTMRQVHSESHLGFELGASYENLAAKVSGDFKYQQDLKFNRFLVKLSQSFYTLACGLPRSYDEVFSPEVTREDLARFIGPGNPPTFISSVTYGRIFYLLIQSTSSSTDMRAQINASFSVAGGTGAVNADVSYLTSLENLEIGGWALGGEASSAGMALTGDLDQLKRFIESGGDIATGAPISYVVRSLAHPDRIVKIKLNTEYDEVDCVPLGLSLDKPLFWFQANNGVVVDTIDGVAYVKGWVNLFNDLRNTRSDASSIAPERYAGTLTGPVPGTDLPAVRFEKSDKTDGLLALSGRDLIGTDYTIFAVVQLDNTATAYPVYFMFGSEDRTLRNLSLGFRDWSTIGMSHQGHDLTADASHAGLGNFNVYTFRFSQTDGMQIFVNGDPQSTFDPSKTKPLRAYPDARIGSGSGATVSIAELKAYGIAVTESQRRHEESILLSSYRR